MIWNICTSEGNPSILLPEGTDIPEGYAVEAQTANPNYLADQAELAITLGRHITVLAFRNRFTPNEKMLIEFHAADNPSNTTEDRMTSASIRASIKDTDNAAYIDLDRDDTRSGVLTFEALGIIGTGRAAEILDTPIRSFELPTYPTP